MAALHRWNPNPQTGYSADSQEQTAQILARQREYGMHDPGCDEREVEKANAHGGAYYLPKPCNCWLAVPQS